MAVDPHLLHAEARAPGSCIVPCRHDRGDDETIEIPAGRFACLRYTRKDPDGVWRFWFALDLPGQPVRYEHEVDGAVVSSVTLLENMTGSAVS